MPELIAYACGSTRHDLSRVFRGGAAGERVFPANAFLYDDGRHRVLFDTGYAAPPWRTGVSGRLYRRLLPPTVEPGDEIAEQLDPESVTHVVISHLHPDHIGGLRHFPAATLVLTPGMLATVRRPRLREGVLRGLLPDWFDRARLRLANDFTPGPHGLGTADLLGDGSYLLVDLPGHARGHLGALVQGRTLLAGDAAWGRDVLGQEEALLPLPRLIAHDHAAQRATAARLLAAEAEGVRVLFSHDPHPTGVNLL